METNKAYLCPGPCVLAWALLGRGHGRLVCSGMAATCERERERESGRKADCRTIRLEGELQHQAGLTCSRKVQSWVPGWGGGLGQ